MAYATLTEFKVWLNEAGSDSDGELLNALVAAEGMIDRYLQRSLAQASITERLYGNSSATLYPSRLPITAVTACIVDGASVEVAFTDIAVRRKDGGSFGRNDEILVTYTGGETTIPPEVKTATMITAQAIYSSGDLDANMTGENLPTGVSGSFQPGGPGSLPPAAKTILAPLRRVHS